MADTETPTREVFRVVSDNTGTVVRDELDSLDAAEFEAKRLNVQATRDGIMHLGVRQSYRAIGPCTVIDEVRELEARIAVHDAEVGRDAGKVKDLAARERLQAARAVLQGQLDEKRQAAGA